MTDSHRTYWRFLVIVLVVLLVVTAANALIDLGAVIHDVTQPH